MSDAVKKEEKELRVDVVPLGDGRIFRYFSEHKERWLQEVYAKNQRGEIVSTRNEEATCFCLEGAIRHFYSGRQQDGKILLYRDVVKGIEAFTGRHYYCVENFNDHSTYEKVMEVVKALNL